MVLLPRQEKNRNKKYSDELVSGGYVSRCVSLVIEHLGGGHKGREFFAAFVTTVSKSRSQF